MLGVRVPPGLPEKGERCFSGRSRKKEGYSPAGGNSAQKEFDVCLHRLDLIGGVRFFVGIVESSLTDGSRCILLNYCVALAVSEGFYEVIIFWKW